MQLEELQKKYEEQKRELETLNRAKEETEDLPAGDNNEEEEMEMNCTETIEELEK